MIDRIPAPNQHGELSESRFFLQDSWYDGYRGTVNLLQGTIHIIRKHLCSTELNLITKFFIKTGWFFLSEQKSLFLSLSTLA